MTWHAPSRHSEISNWRIDLRLCCLYGNVCVVLRSIIKMWTRYVTLVTTALFFVRLCVVFLIDFWGFFLFCFLMVLWDQIRAVFFFSHQLKRNGCNRIFSCLFSLSFSPAVRVCVYVIFDTIQMSSRSLRYQILTVSLTTERKPKQKLRFFVLFFVFYYHFHLLTFVCSIQMRRCYWQQSFWRTLDYYDMNDARRFACFPRFHLVCYSAVRCVCVSNSNAKWRTANGWPAAAACLVLHTSTFG